MDVEQDESLPMDAGPIVDQPKLESEPKLEEPKSEARERDESGRFKAKDKGETQVEAPPASEPDNVPVRALQDERSKRQKLEQDVADLRQQLEQRNATPPPDMFENTEGWQQHFGGQVTQNAAQFASMNARLDTSEMLASTAHEDFDELKAEFLQMAEQNPALLQQARADRHPWEKAYQIAKNARTMKELGATSIEDIEAKLRAKIEEELKSSAPRFPTSTVQDGSVAGRSGPVWTGHTPDKDLLPMG